MPFTDKERRTYQNICHLTERGVLNFMKDILKARYSEDKVIVTPSYIVALGDIPVALVAHADTVFKLPPALNNFFYDKEKDVIWNPDGAGADDRAGIYAITNIIRHTDLRPHVIITTGEESGCIGAGKLIAHMHKFPAELKFMIQLDRRGHDDSVYYDCDSILFEDFINQFGFKTAWGSFSDISVLAPMWKVAAVNLSVGYEDEHHEIERLHVDWLQETIQKTKKILTYVHDNPDVPCYEYIEAKYGYTYRGWHSAWYDYDDDYPIAADESHCFMCNCIEKTADMLPIWYPYGKQPRSCCLECYSDIVTQVVWCKNCGKGVYLSKEEVKKIPDLNNWICEDCSNGSKESTGTVQQSDSLQSGDQSVGSEHGSFVSGLESGKDSLSRQDEWDDLRIGYASDL